MKNNLPIFAKPPSDNISLEDCRFYHVQDIPGLSEPTKGEWDLRKGVDEYLGYVDFKNKTVLELGPASGYLTFHIEKMGGDVTSIELDYKKYGWDIVPNIKYNWQKGSSEGSSRAHNSFSLSKAENAYWYVHKALNSKSKFIHSHVNDLPAELGIYDISIMCNVLLHVQNPYLALKNMLRHTREKMIITEPGGYSRINNFRNIIRNLIRRIMPRPSPSMVFVPREDKNPFVWWRFSPEIIISMVSNLGFKKSTINYHKQIVGGSKMYFFTVVCERTVPIENCDYD